MAATGDVLSPSVPVGERAGDRLLLAGGGKSSRKSQQDKV
jgi:hypothetical protein